MTEETVDATAEEIGEEQEKEAVDFSFAVVKLADGNYRVAPLEGDATLDDIYNACTSVQRNIDTQQVAGAVANAMVQAAMQSQGMTPSGIAVPGRGPNPNRPKR